MKKLFPLLAGLSLLALGGCTSNGTNANPLRGIAASVLYGNAVDRARLAVGRRDVDGMTSATEDIIRAQNALTNRPADARSAKNLAMQGVQFLDIAVEKSGTEKEHFLSLADRKYREAIMQVQKEGGVKAIDAVTLNSIGYYLADNGKTVDDWKLAVVLTKASYDRWPIPKGTASALARARRANGAQDSYAWALFKMGRFQEALAQQEEVVTTVRSIAPQELSAEVVFHMAEIYRVVGEIEKARREYATALAMADISEEQLRSRILDGVKALEYLQV
jgi:tetratricopeptide (TPR) repeat protein